MASARCGSRLACWFARSMVPPQGSVQRCIENACHRRFRAFSAACRLAMIGRVRRLEACMKHSAIVLVVGVVVAVAVGTFIVMDSSNPICPATFDKIELWMSRREAEVLLGGPANAKSSP